MKIKNLLILTLFISFNYSVHSEDKKEAIKEYKLYEELKTRVVDFTNSDDEIKEIINELLKLKTEENSSNAFYGYKILESIRDVKAATMNLSVCLSYEEVIYRTNISHELLIFTHNNSRDYFMVGLKIELEDATKLLKRTRIKITNLTAVLAVNKSLELMDKLEKWVITNSKPILKSSSYTENTKSAKYREKIMGR